MTLYVLYGEGPTHYFRNVYSFSIACYASSLLAHVQGYSKTQVIHQF